MILTLIFLSLVLHVVHYFGLETYVSLLLVLPTEAYIGLTAVLVMIKLCSSLMRLISLVRAFYASLTRLSANLNKVSVRRARRGPTNNTIGKPRGFATSAVRSDNPKNITPPHKQLYNSRLLRLSFKLENFHELFLVKGGRPLINILKGMSIIGGTTTTSGSIRYLCSFV